MAVVLHVSRRELAEISDQDGLGGNLAAVSLAGDETALDQIGEAQGDHVSEVSKAAQLAAQVQFAVQRVLRELRPLDEIERYWRRRWRERFGLLGLLRTKLSSEDPAEEIVHVREHLARGRRILGKCEHIMGDLRRVSSGELAGAEARKPIEAAERLLDNLLRADHALSSSERADLLLSGLSGIRSTNLRAAITEAVSSAIVGTTTTTTTITNSENPQPLSLTLDQDRLYELHNRVPLYDRLLAPKQLLKLAAGGVAVFFVARGTLRFVNFMTQNDDDSKAGLVNKTRAGLATLRNEAHGAAVNLKAGKLPLRHQAVLFWDWLCDHVIIPSRTIAEQMFLRSEREMSKRQTDEAAVRDARQSLRRMIENHREATHTIGEVPGNKISEADLRLISHDYEKEIQSPIRGAVTGHLVELALIQVQYVKTELLDAMLMIDTLLEENKFNTQLVVLAPALLALGALYNGARSLYYMLINDTQSRNQLSFRLRNEALELAASINALHRAESTISKEGSGLGALGDEDRLTEREGRITEAAFRLRRTLATAPVPQVEDSDEMVAAVLDGHLLANTHEKQLRLEAGRDEEAPILDVLLQKARAPDAGWDAARACWMILAAGNHHAQPLSSSEMLKDLRKTPVLADSNRHVAENKNKDLVRRALRTAVTWAQNDMDAARREALGLQSALAAAHCTSDGTKHILNLATLAAADVQKTRNYIPYTDAIQSLNKGMSIEDSIVGLSRPSHNTLLYAHEQLLRGNLLRQCGRPHEALASFEEAIVHAKATRNVLVSSRAALETIVAAAEAGADEFSAQSCDLFIRLYAAHLNLLTSQELPVGSKEFLSVSLNEGKCSRCPSPCKIACLAGDLIVACLRGERPKLATYVLDATQNTTELASSFRIACDLAEEKPVDVSLLHMASAETSKGWADLLQARSLANAGAELFQVATLLQQRKIDEDELMALEASINHTLVSATLADRAGLAFQDYGAAVIKTLRGCHFQAQRLRAQAPQLSALPTVCEDVLYNLTLLEIRAGDVEGSTRRWLYARGLLSNTFDAEDAEDIKARLLRLRGDILIARGSESEASLGRKQLDEFALEQILQTCEKEANQV
ncbi:Nuclear control of ATPase protein 2 [Hondaea fermentalgiana]|uniref:Nuclear control of ATPase protein 2 n=1 Tax=Hondaea fermentalgiana TaxID=2315210 RepID=A0A2R5GNW1_9STRA|nr:Nuclear control of ATPase protein 2 [Hondaea fermentalgiana]|eukprot:GBG29991.1 Nuclear control of ATPase protein 2 [Hondaea fermentalgiana]